MVKQNETCRNLNKKQDYDIHKIETLAIYKRKQALTTKKT